MARSNAAAIDMLHKVEYKSGVGVNRIDTYRNLDVTRYMEEFERLQKEGKILSSYDDNKWMCFSGVVNTGISFDIDAFGYKTHFGKKYNVSAEEIQKVLKLYVVYISGEYTFVSISMKTLEIIRFLTGYGEKDYKAGEGFVWTILDFLRFYGLPKAEIMKVERSVVSKKAGQKSSRELSSLTTYLSIANEIQDIYSDPNVSNEEFIRWFPVFFWTNISFILPMRATEILVTPFDCLEFIKKDDGTTEVWLHILRTSLKKRNRVVRHEIEGDYEEFAYKIAEYTDKKPFTVATIVKYQELTREHKRYRLFDPTSNLHTKDIYSLERMNRLIDSFVLERLVGNTKYAFVKFAAQLDEFETPNVGDSRPIAMSNLRFQDISADICRQLADHESITTSYGYYENVSNTIHASSIVDIQRRINEGMMDVDAFEENLRKKQLPGAHRTCMSPRNPMETGDVADCISNGCQELGCAMCPFYHPTDEMIQKDVKDYKKSLDNAAKDLLMGIDLDRKGKRIDMDGLVLDAQTRSSRFRVISDLSAFGEYKKWARYKNTQTISS